MSAHTPTYSLPEADARRVLMLRAFEASATDDPRWTGDDRVWATRAARDAVPAEAPPARYLAVRAQQAMQRLAARDAAVTRWLARPLWSWRWLLVAVLLGLLAGVAVDAVGGARRIDLLAPPVWGVVLWNLVVYVLLLVPGRGGAVQAWLARRLGAGLRGTGSGPLSAFAADWLPRVMPVLIARAALLLHAAAAALAAGMVVGLYLRGLVLDWRAGWESTFLEPGTVHGLLSVLLAPASAVTGITLPDEPTISALRVGGEVLPQGPAAMWIHLYAATLLLFVIAPRVALAVWAGLRGSWAARRVLLQADDPVLQQWLLQRGAVAPLVQLLPHGAPPTPQAVLALQEALAAVFGPELHLRVAPSVAYGQEDTPHLPPPEPRATLRLVLVDLAATPEADTQGRYLRTLREAAVLPPLALLGDETGFAQRFAGLPERLEQRREAWRTLAQAEGVPFVSTSLDAPDVQRLRVLAGGAGGP